MKVFVVLLAAFVITALFSKIIKGNWELTFSGNLAMCLMLLFTAMGHFMYTKGMTMMIPDIIPLKKQIVYFTGIIEIALGIGLLSPSLRHISGITLVAFFLLILPANIAAAIRHINFETASYDGKGLNYLWFRIPLQLFFIAWVFFFSIKK